MLQLQSWHLILSTSHFQCCKIDGNASLSKHNIEAREQENLFSGEFKADFCQTFNASIVESCKILYDLYRIHSGFSTMVTVTLNSNVKTYALIPLHFLPDEKNSMETNSLSLQAIRPASLCLNLKTISFYFTDDKGKLQSMVIFYVNSDQNPQSIFLSFCRRLST